MLTWDRYFVDAARADPVVMAELLALVRRAYPETPAGAAGGAQP